MFFQIRTDIDFVYKNIYFKKSLILLIVGYIIYFTKMNNDNYVHLSRQDNKVKWSNTEQITIQITDWYSADSLELQSYIQGKHLNTDNYYYSRNIDNDDGEGEDEASSEEHSDNSEGSEENESQFGSEFLVYLFGLTQDGNSVSIKVTGFKPFFYIKIPDNWRTHHLDILMNKLKNKVYPKLYKTALIKYEIIKAKPFYYFTAEDKFNYAKLTFEDRDSLKKWSYLFKKEQLIYGLNNNKPHKYDLYESNIDPMLRLAHIRSILPSGWISIDPKKYRVINSSYKRETTCQIELETQYKQLKHLDKNEIAPIIVASYDIEADSSHGDFPIPKKDYQKLARDIILEYINLYKNNVPIIKQGKTRELINTWINLCFDKLYRNYNINQISAEENLDASKLHQILDEIHDICQDYTNIVAKTLETGKTREDVYSQSDLASDSEQNDSDKLEKQVLLKRLHYLFEHNLPRINFDSEKTSNYLLLAEQVLNEYSQNWIKNTAILVENPVKWLEYVISLAFNPYFDSHNISKIYTKNNKRPSQAVIENIIPKIYEICDECIELLKIKEKIRKFGKKWAEKQDFSKYYRGYDQFGQKYDTIDGITVDEDDEEYENDQEDDDKDVFKTQDDFVNRLTHLLNKYFPEVEGDIVIQIGTTFQKYGEKHPFLKHIITLNTCEDIKNTTIIRDEHKDITFPDRELISGLKKILKKNADQNTLDQNTLDLIKKVCDDIKLDTIDPKIRNRLNKHVLDYNYEQQLSEDTSIVIVESYTTEKEVLLSWKRLIQRIDPDILTGYNIFGFDFKFMYERSKQLGCMEEFTKLGRFTNLPQGLKSQALTSSGLGENYLYYIPMFGRVIVDLYKTIQSGHKLPMYSLNYVSKHFMYKSKNDISPQDIFIKQKGSATDRRLIAEYCLIDCVLCNRLINKLDIITNCIGMSNVCLIPLSYLFLRGQGIKILSLVADQCRKEGYLLPVLEKQEEDTYEGAIVLPPIKNIYFKPIVVCDFNSLYPSCMISENLSHDSYVEPGSKYDNLPEYDYVDKTYDTYKYVREPGKKKVNKVKSGVKTCRFAQYKDKNKKSLLPRILRGLLEARKNTRKDQKQFSKGSFEWKVKEGLQLAYKITANSLYGQVGASTSFIYFKDIAACTTATGRELIYFTKNFFESKYKNCIAVYGDTDSVFLKFDCKDSSGQDLEGLDAIYKSIELCIEGSLAISRQLKPPHNLEFEKGIFPFILFTKKRYHGHYYTIYGVNNYYANSMGIVLKRRDNANIVKHIYGAVIDIIMIEHDIGKAMEYAQKMAKDLLKGKFPMEMFVITKSLKSYYKNPMQIAHNVLAQRIGKRDPGNKPQSNDRIPYAYVTVPNAKRGERVLQGDRIETPQYITDNNLKIDYKFYLTNQIKKPVVQIFSLVTDTADKLFDEVIQDYDLKLKGYTKITDFF